MLDRRNKGGKSLLMKCPGTVLKNVPCAFHVELRRSSKDSMWHLCKGYNLRHTCCVRVKRRTLRSDGAGKLPCNPDLITSLKMLEYVEFGREI